MMRVTPLFETPTYNLAPSEDQDFPGLVSKLSVVKWFLDGEFSALTARGYAEV